METCSEHPTQEAAWTCSGCGKLLCPGCAAEDEIRGKRIARCIHCGDVATLRMVPRPFRPYWTIFPKLVGAVVHPLSILTLAGIAVVMFIVRFLPMVGGLLSVGIFAGYFFLTLRHAMGGATTLPRPGDFSNLVDDVVYPAFRLFLATAVLWVPSLAYAVWRMDAWSAMGDTPWMILADPGLLVLLALSASYFPGALIVAAVNENLLSILNPTNVLGLALRIPGAYLITVAVVAALGVLDLGVAAAVGAVAGSIPILGPVLVLWSGMVVPLLIAMILGRLIFQNSVAFGLAIPEAERVPAVPGARPSATLPEHLRKKEDPVPQRRDPFRDRVVTPATEPIPLETTPSPPPAPEPIPLETTPDPPAAPAAGPLPLTMTHTPRIPDAEIEGPAGDFRPDAAEPVGHDPFAEGVPAPPRPPAGPPPEAGREAGDLDNTSMAEAMYDPGRTTAAAMAAIQPRSEPAVTSAFDGAPRPAAAPPAPPAAAASAPADPMADLRAALQAGDQARAVEVYAALVGDGLTPRLDAQQDLRLATYLAETGRYTDAVFACRRVAQGDPTGPLAPGATFTAARLLFEKMGQRDQAAALLRHLIQSYPDHALAGRARDALAKMGG